MDSVVILTIFKNASKHLETYFKALGRLTYPADRLSIGLLEGDSDDGTYEALQARLPELRQRYRRADLWKRDFGFRLPAGMPRWAPVIQIPRRAAMSKSRNHLLSRGLQDEDWVLWIDVDVIEYPADVIEQLLAVDGDIVHPHCVKTYGGPTFDLNAWRDRGTVHMDALRGGKAVVRLDTVGGTMLLVRADAHRDGLIFPPYLYGARNPLVRDPNPLLKDFVGEIESEGLGLMAYDMGYRCLGLPNLEILHADE